MFSMDEEDDEGNMIELPDPESPDPESPDPEPPLLHSAREPTRIRSSQRRVWRSRMRTTLHDHEPIARALGGAFSSERNTTG